MKTRSYVQRHATEASEGLTARVQPRSFSDRQFDQPQPTHHDFSHVDLFSHAPQRSSVQPKLTVGAPGDQYEQEADRVAEQVMSMPDSTTQQPIQRQAEPEDEELQTKPLAASITPVIQREALPEEEELQTKPLGNTIQREALPEEEEPVQAKFLQREALPGEEEEVQTKPLSDTIQREAEAEEQEELQAKSLEHAAIQREAEAEEEEVQTKPSLQRSDNGHSSTDNHLENQLNSSKGNGSPLPDAIRSFMEPRFGADFSQVRVHTDSNAVQMNQSLNAQAFAHQQDIYFGAGKTPANDALTAHELTHVVQQNAATIKRYPSDSPLPAKIGQVQRQAPEENKENHLTPEEEQEWLQAKPQVQLQAADTIQRAWTGRRQLSGLGFLGKPWVVRKSGNLVNMRLFHEHIFFEDGVAPPNYGHMGTQGLGEDTPGKLSDYSQVRTNLDDGKMRTAVATVGNPGAYGLLSNNCQDYVQGVLRVYDRLNK